MADKNQDIIELIIRGEDEYSGVSEEVRKELQELANRSKSVRDAITELDRALDLTESYNKQTSEVKRLTEEQGRLLVALNAAKEENRQHKGLNEEAAIALEKAKQAYKANNQELNAANRELNTVNQQISKYGVNVNDVAANQDKYKDKTKELNKELGDLTQRQNTVIEQAGKEKTSTDVVASAQEKLANITKILAAAYATLMTARKAYGEVVKNVEAYAEEEKAMIGVQKTTDLTNAAMRSLRDEFVRLSTDVIPATSQELLNIAGAAGTMGIKGADNIATFAKSITAMAEATDLTADTASQALAQILNLTHEPIKNIDNIGSAIVALGNSTATTESQIVEFMKRMAAEVSSFEMRSTEVAGFAASFAELGAKVQSSGAVVGDTFRKIDDAVKTGGDKLEAFAQVLGVSAEEVRAQWGESQSKLFLNLAKGIKNATDNGESLNNILGNLNLSGSQASQILSLVASNHERFATNIEIAEQAYAAADAHFKELAKTAASLSDGFTRLQNRSDALRTAFGEAMASGLSEMLADNSAKLSELNNLAASLGEETIELTKSVFAFTSSIGNASQSIGDLVAGGDLLHLTFNTLINGIEGFSLILDGISWSIAVLAKNWNEFFGDDQAAKKWADAQQEAFDAMQRSMDNIERRREVFAGNTSHAYEELKNAVFKYTDSLENLDRAELDAINSIINKQGYLEGYDDVYRNLARSVQRAAEQDRIHAELTQEGNIQLKERVKMLQAGGMAYEEAMQVAIEALTEEAAATQEADKQTKTLTTTFEALESTTAKTVSELHNFKDAISSAFGEGRISAEQLITLQDQYEQQLDKLNRQTLKDLGMTFEDVFGGISDSEQAAIDGIKQLIDSTEMSFDQLQRLIDASYKKLKNPEAFNAAKEAIKAWAGDNKAKAELVEAAFERLGNKANSVFDGIVNSIKRAKSAQELTDLGDKLENMFNAGELSAEDYISALEQTQDRQQELGDDLDNTDGKLEKVGQTTRETADKTKELGDKAEEAGEKSKGMGASFGGAINAIAGRLHALSQATQDAFFGAMGMIGGARQAESELERMQNRLDQIKQQSIESQNWSGLFAQAFGRVERAANEAEGAYLSQKIALEKLVEQFEKGEVSADWLTEATWKLESQFGMLNDADLSRLESAIDSVKSRTDALNDSLENTVSNLEKDIANLKGQQDVVEEMNHKERVAELEHQKQLAQMSGDAKALELAQQALKLEEERFKIKMDNIKASQEEANQRKQEREQKQTEKELDKDFKKEADSRKQTESSFQQQTKTATSDKMITVKFDVGGSSSYGEFSDTQINSLIRKLQEIGAVSR